MRVVGLVFVSVLVSGCPLPPGDDAGRVDDAGGGGDAGGGDDAGLDDAGLDDAGLDDAGNRGDAGSVDDAGHVNDAGDLGDAGSAVDAGPLPNPVRLRVVAANLTSGNFQSYDPGHGQRILQGLGPDLVLIQEFSYGDDTPAELRAFVDETFGASFDYHRESAQLPNGVISRFPIVEAGVWDDAETTNRELVWARVDVPGPKDLWAVSLHLLTANAGTRATEAEQLVGYVQANVPAADLLVIGGDLNTDSAGEAALSALAAVVSFAHTPQDQDGNPNTNAGRTKPYDWVLPDDDLGAFAVPVVIGSNTFPDGLVFDSRVYTPLVDVAPVQIGDSDATAMQHMAVVKDFLLPASP